jgi:hypothetical protein
MDKKRTIAGPIIAALLLIIPVLYVGSYFALVVPSGINVFPPDDGMPGGSTSRIGRTYYYRFEITWGERFFWPLHQLHRKIRPDDWQDIRVRRFFEQMERISTPAQSY